MAKQSRKLIKVMPPESVHGCDLEPCEYFLDHLKKSHRVLVQGHHNPDGDALGSAVALSQGLSALGLETVIGLSGRLSANLEFILEKAGPVLDVTGHPGLLSDFDLLLLVDCQGPERVWPEIGGPEDLAGCPFLVLDHHPVEKGIFRPVSSFHDQRASSAGELVFKLLKALDLSFTPVIVEALLVAIITDTGSFSQGNTTAECLSQAAFLVSQGGDIETVQEQLKKGWSLKKIKLLTMALATLEIHLEGRLATMLLTEEMLSRAGATLDDADGFVEYPRILAGVDLAVLLRTDGRGHTRVSLRSRPQINASALAVSLGGGGHRQAAAYTDEASSPEIARQRFLEKASIFINGHR